MINPWTAFSEFMTANVAPTLKGWHHPLDMWIATLPDWTGRLCAVGLFVLAGCWALTLKRSYIYLGAPDNAPWRDLRIWAVLVLIPYIVIYLRF